MAALTAEQLADMQADLAIGSDQSVFTDAELQRLYDRASSDYNLAVYYGWRQIAADASRWVNYRVAQTQVDRGAAFDHIKAMVAFWGNESKAADDQLLSAGIGPVPSNHKPRPADDTYHTRGYYRRGRWWPYA